MSRRSNGPVAKAVAIIAFLSLTGCAGNAAWRLALSEVCPRCAGFDRVSPGLYVQRDLPPSAKLAFQSEINRSKILLQKVFADPETTPNIYLCSDDDCYRSFSGAAKGSLALTFSYRSIVLSPDRIPVVTLTHEMAHVELHRRLSRQQVSAPAWFDEGFAVMVSGDRRYIPESDAASCNKSQDDLPVTKESWIRAASADRQVYTLAACKVRLCVRKPKSDAVEFLVWNDPDARDLLRRCLGG